MANIASLIHWFNRYKQSHIQVHDRGNEADLQILSVLIATTHLGR